MQSVPETEANNPKKMNHSTVAPTKYHQIEKQISFLLCYRLYIKNKKNNNENS